MSNLVLNISEMNTKDNLVLIEYIYAQSMDKKTTSQHPLSMICEAVNKQYNILMDTTIDSISEAHINLVVEDDQYNIVKKLINMINYLLKAHVECF